MRLVLYCALAMATPAFGEGITIVLDFQGPHSEQSVSEMKREFEGIMKGAPVHFDWRTRAEATESSVRNLVVMRFKGKCVLEPVGYLYDERGPMAFTYATDGVVQPFGEVECDKVTSAVRSALFGGDYAKANRLLGRALGRVLAHEVVHMLTRSAAHGRSGVTRPALTPGELIAPELRLTSAELDLLKSLPPMVACGAAPPFNSEVAIAQLHAVRCMQTDAVKINANANPWGPAS